MSRPTSIHVNLERLCENFRCARRLHGGSLLAVVKANAYGHGAVTCARALAPQAEGFAVATLEEGAELRAAGITQPVVLLEGIFSAADLEQVRHQALTAVLHQPWQVQLQLEQEVSPVGGFWLKFDSGMHRLGLNESDLRRAVDQLRRKFPGVGSRS
ncbi:alanine racemase 1, PLP-binding, biosynthetic (fragment) [mine drainage metagenome]|uniref:Alanine racemase 1, PLP-binding, biosynthetic n=1 Tax=mine drainage metagenome TaxID=410659 RepID=A0A3P3ZML9_9ZZZZ